jgi:acyl carrier protein
MEMATKQAALRLLEEMLDLGPQTLTGSERLADLEAWDSLSVVVFIAQVDKQLGVPLPGGRVAKSQTVDELCRLVMEAAAAKAA